MDIKNDPVKVEYGNVSPELVKFFYLSFRHSQGYDKIQRYFFEYAAMIGASPPIPEKIPEELLDKLRAPKHHGERREDERQNFSLEWNRMAKIFSKREHMGYDLDETIDLILDRDTRYMEVRDRKVPEGNSTLRSLPDTDRDLHASYVRRYIILGEPTGSSVFDRLFLLIKEELSTNSSFKDKLETLKSHWEWRHPGYQFFPENKV